MLHSPGYQKPDSSADVRKGESGQYQLEAGPYDGLRAAEEITAHMEHERSDERSNEKRDD